jgi:hypothetical protein
VLLTFQLAADIIETSVTTDWDVVGRIAVIAVIRTFLNYFLERDLDEIRGRDEPAAAAQRTRSLLRRISLCPLLAQSRLFRSPGGAPPRCTDAYRRCWTHTNAH